MCATRKESVPATTPTTPHRVTYLPWGRAPRIEPRSLRCFRSRAVGACRRKRGQLVVRAVPCRRKRAGPPGIVNQCSCLRGNTRNRCPARGRRPLLIIAPESRSIRILLQVHVARRRVLPHAVLSRGTFALRVRSKCRGSHGQLGRRAIRPTDRSHVRGGMSPVRPVGSNHHQHLSTDCGALPVLPDKVATLQEQGKRLR